MRFSVVDVETSGLSTRRHRVLQVGLVSIEDGRLVDEWESKIRLAWPLQRVGPRRVHGLSRADLRGAPRNADVMSEVAARIAGTILVAHNLEFDRGFLDRASRRAGINLEPNGTICTLRLSRSSDPSPHHRHGLADVAARFGVVNQRPHDALEDARTTALVLPHLLRAAGIEGDAEVEALAHDQSAYLANNR